MIRKTTIWISLIYLLGLVIVIYDRHILPAKFFYDARHIQTLLICPFSIHLFNSFLNTAYFYKLFGFSLYTPFYFASIFSYTLGFFCLILFLYKENYILNNKTLLIFFVWNIIFAIYIGQYSKELIALIVSIIIISIATTKTSLDFLLFTIIFIFYTLFYRIYWILVFYFFILIKIGWLYRPKIFNILISIFISFIFTLLLFITIHFVTNRYLTDSRYIVNINRIGSVDAQSMILNPFKNSSVITDILNNIIVFIYLIFPIKLLLTKMKLEYLIFIVWEIFNSLFFIKIVYYLSHRKSLVIKRWDKITNCIALIIAFTIVQAMFEPDYGSFLKHQTILLAAYFYLIFIYYKVRIYCKYLELRCLYEDNSCR